MRRGIATLLAAGGLAFVLANTARAEELTIFWAEWDPANYLQELVNDYTKETGVKVTVETTPWTDFQTKTFANSQPRETPTTWSSATRNGWAQDRPKVTMWT